MIHLENIQLGYRKGLEILEKQELLFKVFHIGLVLLWSFEMNPIGKVSKKKLCVFAIEHYIICYHL